MSNQNFADFLRKRLKELDLNESEFANNLILRGYKKASKQSINKWTNGKALPDFTYEENRNALVSVLRVDIETILEVIGYIQPKHDSNHQLNFAFNILKKVENDELPRIIGILSQFVKE